MRALLILFVFSPFLQAQDVERIFPKQKISVPVEEPSDVCVKGNEFIVVSDKGDVFSLSKDFSQKRLLHANLSDPEGVFCAGDSIWVAEERSRLVTQLLYSNPAAIRSVEIPYSGGRNKGYEAICRNPKGNWLLFTEKEPVWMIELDAQFHEIGRAILQLPGDVSSAAFYNGHLFLLSDEAACVWKMDLATNKILKTYTFNILNAEGLCFEADGGMWILSDAEQKIYQFEKRSW